MIKSHHVQSERNDNAAAHELSGLVSGAIRIAGARTEFSVVTPDTTNGKCPLFLSITMTIERLPASGKHLRVNFFPEGAVKPRAGAES